MAAKAKPRPTPRTEEATRISQLRWWAKANMASDTTVASDPARSTRREPMRAARWEESIPKMNMVTVIGARYNPEDGGAGAKP